MRRHTASRLFGARGAASGMLRAALAAAIMGGDLTRIHAATLLTWDITATTGSTSGSAANPLVAGITGSALNGSTLTTGNSTSPSNTWNRTYQAVTYTTAADAMANGQYLSWTTSVDAGYTASFTGFTGMNLSRTSNGAQAVELWYSTDGLSFVPTGSAAVVPGSAAAAFSSGMVSSPIVLAGGTTGATITWRMVAYSGTGGRLGISRTSTDDVSMLGTISGGSARDLTWVGTAGVGTWDTDTANMPWSTSGSAAPFAANDNVAFPIAGDVTVAGGVAAGAVTVSHTAGLLTIGGGGFTGTTLVKTGGGDLALAAGNDLSGGSTIGGGRLLFNAPGALGTKSVSVNGAAIVFNEAAVSAVANPLLVGSGGAMVSTAVDLAFSGGVTAASGAGGSVFTKSGSGVLTLSGAFGVLNTAPLELDVAEGTVSLAGSQKNLGGGNDWTGAVALDGAIVMLHGGTVAGSGVVTNRSAASVVASRLNVGPVAFQSGVTLEQTLTGSSPNGNNVLRFLGPLGGAGGFTAAGNGIKQLWGRNTYTGPTRVVAGTLGLGTRTSLYDGVTADWTSDKFTVQGGATASFRVGGVGQFEATDFDVLLGLGTEVDGFLSGSRIAFDTTDGSFAYGNAIANPNGGANVLGITKSGSNRLELSGSNTYTGSTQVTAGTLLFETRSALYGGDAGSWAAANLIVSSGATAAFGVGGGDGFTAGDIAALAALGSGTTANGFLSGSRLGIDTSAAGSFTYAAVLGDPDSGGRALGLVKLGTGTLALAAANTYTGGTIVEDGTLVLGNSAALGTAPGPLVIEGGAVDLGGHAITLPALGGGGGAVTNGGPGAATLTIAVASGTTTYGGILMDGAATLALVKTGSGYLQLGGASGFSGGTTLTGDVGITQAAGLGIGPIVSASADARVRWSGTESTVTITNPVVTGDDATDALAFRPGAGNTVVLSGAISGSGQLKISASAGGSLDLSQQTAATNTNTGGVEIGTGRVLIATGESLGAGTVNFGTGSNSVLVLTGSAAIVTNPITMGSTTGTTASIATIDTGAGVLTLVATMADRAGNAPGSLVKLGSGTLRLAAANTYGGTTTVREGTLVVGHASAVGSAPVSVVSGGTLALSPYLEATAPGLSLTGGGLVDVTTGRLTIAGASAPHVVAELVAGRGDGSWSGSSGITSSVAAAAIASSIPRAVGWLDDGSGAIAVAFAAPGDTNIDWTIDILDAANFLALGKFDTGEPAAWVEGDFSYDGLVDILDAADFFATGLFDAGTYNAPPAGAVPVAVPEPATVGLLGLLAASVIMRGRLRRRPSPPAA